MCFWKNKYKVSGPRKRSSKVHKVVLTDGSGVECNILHNVSETIFGYETKAEGATPNEWIHVFIHEADAERFLNAIVKCRKLFPRHYRFPHDKHLQLKVLDFKIPAGAFVAKGITKFATNPIRYDPVLMDPDMLAYAYIKSQATNILINPRKGEPKYGKARRRNAGEAV